MTKKTVLFWDDDDIGFLFCPFHSQYANAHHLGRSTLKRELFKLCNCLNSVKAGKGEGLN